MIEKTVVAESGLESRVAALFVQNAGKYRSKINISMGDKMVNAKSIMGVISLGVVDKQSVTITVEGEDEDEAMAEMLSFLKEQSSK